jgi:hypothetical protein
VYVTVEPGVYAVPLDHAAEGSSIKTLSLDY